MNTTIAPLARTDIRAAILAGLVIAVLAFAAAVVPPNAPPSVDQPAVHATHVAPPVNHAGKKP